MRRMFRRDRRKEFAPNIPPILQEANLAFDKGEYGRAAELFERIAQAADARGPLYAPRAPLLHLQAGRARILAGQTALGMPSLKRGLELLKQSGSILRLHRSLRRIIAELTEHGLTKEASEIEAWFEAELPTAPKLDEMEITKRPILPTHCPACGAPLRTDEVEWMDDITAECGYCGSPVRETK